MVLPVHFDTRIRLVETRDGALDVIVKGWRKPESPEGNFCIWFNTFNHRFWVGARHWRHLNNLGLYHSLFYNLRSSCSWSCCRGAASCQDHRSDDQYRKNVHIFLHGELSPLLGILI